MPDNKIKNPQEKTVNVALINAEDNPVAVFDEQTFSGKWHWHKTASSWKPGDPLPAADSIDAMIVFAAKYQEDEVGHLCKEIRQRHELDAIPLLVAVDQYQMPLANRVREFPNTDFVITPIEEGSLTEHLNRAVRGKE